MKNNIIKLFKLSYKLRSNGLINQADDLDYKLAIKKANEDLMDKNPIENGIKSAKNLLTIKWSADYILQKVANVAKRKISSQDIESLKKNIISLINSVNCIILPEKEFNSKIGERAYATYIPSDKTIYFKQMSKEDAEDVLKNPNYFTLLAQHEISHVIYEYLVKTNIYDENKIKSIVVPPQAERFSKSNYIYDPTEMVSRMTSVRSGFLIDPFTSGEQIATKIFKQNNIPCERQGKYYLVTVEGSFGYQNVEKAPIFALGEIFEKYFINEGWEASDLEKLLIPYIKNVKDTGFELIITIDLDNLAKAMNQIAIKNVNQKSKLV